MFFFIIWNFSGFIWILGMRAWKECSGEYMHSWDQVNLLTYNCNSLGILHVLMIRWNFHFGVSGLLHLQKEEETDWENFPQFQGNLLWSNEHNWQDFVQNIKLKPENFTDFLIHEVRIALPAELFNLRNLCRLVSQGLKFLLFQHTQQKASKGHCR